MNKRSHPDFSGLVILLACIYVMATLIEGGFLAVFILSILKWDLPVLAALSGIALVLWPIRFFNKKGF